MRRVCAISSCCSAERWESEALTGEPPARLCRGHHRDPDQRDESDDHGDGDVDGPRTRPRHRAEREGEVPEVRVGPQEDEAPGDHHGNSREDIEDGEPRAEVQVQQEEDDRETDRDEDGESLLSANLALVPTGCHKGDALRDGVRVAAVHVSLAPLREPLEPDEHSFDPQLFNGTNLLEIAVVGNPAGHVLLIVRLDNLGKGAGCQGVQCLNLMLGLPEGAGLEDGGD